MNNSYWTGTGPTPYEAAKELVPGPDVDYVGWIMGLRALIDRSDPPMYDDVFEHELTIYYEDLPAKQWRIKLHSEADGWRAEFLGSKRV